MQTNRMSNPETESLTVLYVSGISNYTGASKSLCCLIDSLPENIKPVVLLETKEGIYDYLSSRGVKCLVYPYQTLLEKPFGKNIKYFLFHPWRFWFVKLFRLDLRCLYCVRKALADEKIDIVHTNMAPVLMGQWLSKMLKIPHVWHIREYLTREHLNARVVIPLSRLKRRINEADGRIVISDPCREYWALTEHNTWTIWPAVRRKSEACFEKEKAPYILYCSMVLTEGKNVALAIQAFGKSGLSGKGMKMKVVGNATDEYLCYLKRLGEQWGCGDALEFLPRVDDVKPLFAKATAFIMPSVNEGFGRTTAEAMFFGCPVIAYASGGTVDLIKDGETGYLFTTLEECARLMRFVSESDQENVILRAQEFAKKHLSTDDYGEKVVSVYRTVMGAQT